MVKAATKKDKERYQKLADLGCIVCLLWEGAQTPPEIHHPYGRTGDGNQKTYPLCHKHHNSGKDTEHYTSRHPFKARFEERYETDAELLERTNRLININFTD